MTLANALEKANIDYVLLEAHDTISPQVGASIGIFANGGRIVDQLGCFDKIEHEIVGVGLHHSRDGEGNLMYPSDAIKLTQTRYGI